VCVCVKCLSVCVNRRSCRAETCLRRKSAAPAAFANRSISLMTLSISSESIYLMSESMYRMSLSRGIPVRITHDSI
jgi:hypothetical protein